MEKVISVNNTNSHTLMYLIVREVRAVTGDETHGAPKGRDRWGRGGWEVGELEAKIAEHLVKKQMRRSICWSPTMRRELGVETESQRQGCWECHAHEIGRKRGGRARDAS